MAEGTRATSGCHKGQSPGAHKDNHEDFALRGFITCTCGQPLTGGWSRGRNRIYGYYLCQRKGCDHYGKSIKKRDLESAFEKLLIGLRPSENLFSMAQKMFKKSWDTHVQKRGLDNVALEKELAQIDRQIEQLLDRIMLNTSGSIVSAYEKRIEKLEEQKIVLGGKIVKTGVALPDYRKTSRTALSFLASPCNLWRSEAFRGI